MRFQKYPDSCGRGLIFKWRVSIQMEQHRMPFYLYDAEMDAESAEHMTTCIT